MTARGVLEKRDGEWVVHVTEPDALRPMLHHRWYAVRVEHAYLAEDGCLVVRGDDDRWRQAGGASALPVLDRAGGWKLADTAREPVARPRTRSYAVWKDGAWHVERRGKLVPQPLP